MVHAIPEGTHSVTPHLVVRGAARAIGWYEQAFGATEMLRMPMPGTDRLAHAEIRVADSAVYLADEFPDWGSLSPLALKGSPVTIHLYVEDADAWFDRAVKAGAKVTMPMNDAFWGDRYGQVVDPFGHRWSIATHKEDLTPEEMARRGEEAMKSMPPPPKARRSAPRKKAAKGVVAKTTAARKPAARAKAPARKPGGRAARKGGRRRR